MKIKHLLLLILMICTSLFLIACDSDKIESESGDTEVSGEPVSPYADSKDIFASYYDKADSIIKNMTLKEKVGQLFLAKYPAKFEDANKEIETLYPSGYILFADNFKEETKTSIVDKISANQKRSKINMFIAVDEEGGTVNRISSFEALREKPFDSPLNIYEKDGMDAVVENAIEKSKFLKSFGINMNLAPVVDIPTNKKSFIYKRSFGTKKELTSEFAKEVISAMNEEKLVSCMKHFPGYADNVDTHKNVATDKRKEDSFYSGDFLPFIAGIEENAPAIMVCHNIVQAFDSEKPASLSKAVHDILRNDLGFTGLIITDDLAMTAVSKYTKAGSSAKEALLSGNDLIITSNLKTNIDEILTAVSEGEISVDVIDTAVRRILGAKLFYGIIENK